jgi:hypothetical protein
MRSSVGTSVLEIGSIVAIVVGASLVSVAAGWIIGGLAGLALSWRLAR